MATGKTRISQLITILFLTCASNLVSQVKDFPNEYAWTWQVGPITAPKGSYGTVGFHLLFNELKDGDLLLVAISNVNVEQGVHSFRAIAFDSAGRRFEFKSQSSSSSSGIIVRSFRLPSTTLSMNTVKFIGIEKLTEDNLRTLLSPPAYKKLKEAHQQALRYPEIGKPYEFELVTIEGVHISSKSFLGKVVLLDFWASWCSPCMAKMPKLKETYAELNGRGFAIIGLNHDSSPEIAKKFTMKEQLPWPIVLAPPEDQYRELWQVSVGVTTLPRLLLLDRKGYLRADVAPYELSQRIKSLVEE